MFGLDTQTVHQRINPLSPTYAEQGYLTPTVGVWLARLLPPTRGVSPSGGAESPVC